MCGCALGLRCVKDVHHTKGHCARALVPLRRNGFGQQPTFFLQFDELEKGFRRYVVEDGMYRYGLSPCFFRIFFL